MNDSAAEAIRDKLAKERTALRILIRKRDRIQRDIDSSEGKIKELFDSLDE